MIVAHTATSPRAPSSTRVGQRRTDGVSEVTEGAEEDGGIVEDAAGRWRRGAAADCGEDGRRLDEEMGGKRRGSSDWNGRQAEVAMDDGAATGLVSLASCRPIPTPLLSLVAPPPMPYSFLPRRHAPPPHRIALIDGTVPPVVLSRIDPSAPLPSTAAAAARARQQRCATAVGNPRRVRPPLHLHGCPRVLAITDEHAHCEEEEEALDGISTTYPVKPPSIAPEA
ncbi:hypothetical protein ACP70R_000850 [Stipagrostis hirtigluma subsp. patula]